MILKEKIKKKNNKMILNKEIEERILQKTVETVNKINAHYKINLKVPKIYYDIKGTNAGMAKFPAMTLHLNPKLLLNNLEDSIINTIPHEVCHLGVFQRSIELKKKFPKGHGAEWKLMMWVVGADAKTYHKYDVSELKKTMSKYHYQCNCEEGHVVSKILHNKIQAGSTRKCIKCNVKLHSWTKILNHGFSRPSPNGTTNTRE